MRTRGNRPPTVKRRSRRTPPWRRGESCAFGPAQAGGLLNLRELWRYRELLWFLALRNIQVRYKQTVFGAGWAIIQPLFTMLVFSVFFGNLGGMGKQIKDPNIRYSVYTFCALLPWQLFAYALAQGSVSVVANRGLITKIYFPRLLVPVVPLLCGLLDFAISFVLLAVMMACYGIIPGWRVLALPLFVVLALAVSLAVSLWLSALNALYRDVQYTLVFLTQFWLFATPVAYPASIVPEALAVDDRPESDGRGGRGFPLVPAGYVGNLRYDDSGVAGHRRPDAGGWAVLLPADGEDLCRRGLRA